MSFPRAALPERFCNLDRLLASMRARKLDGVVVSTPLNVFYLSGFNGMAHKADEPRPYALLLSRHDPGHPILVIADYYLGTFLAQPTWVRDIRPFRAVMMPLDVPPAPGDIDRFIPKNDAAWMRQARGNYAFDMGTALRTALRELGLDNGRVGFDDVGFGQRLKLEKVEVADAYDPLMFARAVKTQDELSLLRRSTALNRAAIEATVGSWREGMTWRDINHAYHRAVVDLGGFVRDPGAMVWGHPRGGDPALTLQTGLEDFAVERGTHVMFDCHGTLDLYCWDGGKTWIVGGETGSAGRRNLRATAAAAEALLEAMRPGARPSSLQSVAREAYRKAGVPDPHAAAVFFHGLGLSHMDIEQTTADGAPNHDWVLEAGMVVPMHLVYPAGERERAWVEEVVLITEHGCEPFFGWGFEPLQA
jgi:Xaa-Pro dipeptidase